MGPKAKDGLVGSDDADSSSIAAAPIADDLLNEGVCTAPDPLSLMPLGNHKEPKKGRRGIRVATDQICTPNISPAR